MSAAAYWIGIRLNANLDWLISGPFETKVDALNERSNMKASPYDNSILTHPIPSSNIKDAERIADNYIDPDF